MIEHKDLQWSLADVKILLEEAGILPTQQRLDIARAILARPQHLSADQLLALVNQSSAGVSKATVYNTLSLFARKGIVREIVVDPNRVFFDSNRDAHCHIYNEDSGELTDICADGLLSEALPELPDNTELVNIDVIIRVRRRHSGA